LREKLRKERGGKREGEREGLREGEGEGLREGEGEGGRKGERGRLDQNIDRSRAREIEGLSVQGTSECWLERLSD